MIDNSKDSWIDAWINERKYDILLSLSEDECKQAAEIAWQAYIELEIAHGLQEINEIMETNKKIGKIQWKQEFVKNNPFLETLPQNDREELVEKKWQEYVNSKLDGGGGQDNENNVIEAPPLYQSDMDKVKNYSLDGKHTIAQIAGKVGISVSTVNRYRKILGIRHKK